MHSLLGLSGKLPTLPTVFIGAMARRLAKVSPASQNTETLQLGAFWTPGLGVPGTPSMGALEALGWHARNSAESCTPGLKRAL